MLPRSDASDGIVTGLLGGAIVVVLIAGLIAAFTVSDDSETKTDTPESQVAPDEATRRAQEEAAQSAAARAAANEAALRQIQADQEECRRKYLAAAQARAAEATQHLKEQEVTLRRIHDQLPPGKAKESLASQLGPEFESSQALIDAELRAAEDRCRLALSVYQYTQAEGAPPPSG